MTTTTDTATEYAKLAQSIMERFAAIKAGRDRIAEIETEIATEQTALEADLGHRAELERAMGLGSEQPAAARSRSRRTTLPKRGAPTAADRDRNSGTTLPKQGAPTAADRGRDVAVRAWAAEKGIQLYPRRPIPPDVEARFDAERG